MKESTQTLWFLAAAVGAVLLAVGTQPSVATVDPNSLIGKPLNRAFEAEQAASLRVVRFDEETATLREFEVAEQDGVWSIPSKGGYPADAERQMGEATAGVMDREILQVVSDTAADHEKYGVVDPLGTVEVGQTGVGTRVTLATDGGDALVDLVVGKEVKDAEDQRYVRRASQDVVFVTELDTEALSTDFADWIEDDLLKLNSFDVRLVKIRDYTAELVPQGFRIGVALEQNTEMTLRYDDGASEWTADELRAWDTEAEAYKPFQLAADEELNSDNLRELKNALDDLRIVDVERKPAGLSADLRGGEDFFKDQESALDLMSRGFALTTGNEVLSSQGEVVCTMKTGVEYVLRFGDLQTTLDGDDASGGEDAEGEEAESANRYLFVMARFDEAAIDSPDLEEVPSDEAVEPPADATAEDDDAAEEATDAIGDDEGEPADDASDEDPGDDGDETTDDLAAKGKEIEARNARKMAEYESKIREGRDRVAELNDRFGDWYYVVADDVYKKVRLSREDVIKTAEPADGEEGAGGAAAPKAPLPGLPALPGLGDDAAE